MIPVVFPFPAAPTPPRLLPFMILLLTVAVAAQGTWTRLNVPTLQALRHVQFVDAETGWAAGDSGGIVHTGDGGVTWEIQSSVATNSISDLFFLDAQRGWATYWNYSTPPYGTVILSTTNGGQTWESSDYPAENVFLTSVFFHDSLNGLAGGLLGEINYTEDGGQTWTPATLDSGSADNLPWRSFHFLDRNFGFGCGGRFDLPGVIWRTFNGGLSWDSSRVGPEPIQKMAFLDPVTIIGVGGDFEYGSGAVRSTDGGGTWDYRSLETFGVAFGLGFRTPREGWAALGFAREFIRTTNGGLSWGPEETPENSSILDIVFPDSLTGYAVGDSGRIYKYTSQGVGIGDETVSRIPESHRLYPNYPNPFNPATRIPYRLATAAAVRIEVFSVLGERVAVVVDERRPAGVYEARFEGGGLPAGVYLVRMQAGAYRGVEKMVLVK